MKRNDRIAHSISGILQCSNSEINKVNLIVTELKPVDLESKLLFVLDGVRLYVKQEAKYGWKQDEIKSAMKVVDLVITYLTYEDTE